MYTRNAKKPNQYTQTMITSPIYYTYMYCSVGNYNYISNEFYYFYNCMTQPTLTREYSYIHQGFSNRRQSKQTVRDTSSNGGHNKSQNTSICPPISDRGMNI